MFTIAKFSNITYIQIIIVDILASAPAGDASPAPPATEGAPAPAEATPVPAEATPATEEAPPVDTPVPEESAPAAASPAEAPPVEGMFLRLWN